MGRNVLGSCPPILLLSYRQGTQYGTRLYATDPLLCTTRAHGITSNIHASVRSPPGPVRTRRGGGVNCGTHCTRLGLLATEGSAGRELSSLSLRKQNTNVARPRYFFSDFPLVIGYPAIELYELREECGGEGVSASTCGVRVHRIHRTAYSHISTRVKALEALWHTEHRTRGAYTVRVPITIERGPHQTIYTVERGPPRSELVS